MYPMIVLAMSIVEMIGVIFFILPRMDDLFAAFDDPPATTKMILTFTEFIRDNTPVLLASIIGTFVMALVYFSTKRGKITRDKLLLKIPIMKDLTKKNILSTLARTLTVLLESGIPIQSAINITGESTSNVVYKDLIKKIEVSVKGGENIAESMARYPKYFPPTFVKMIQIGEQTGSLEDNLTYLYEFYAEEVEEMSNNLATLLEPLMLIFIGLMIGLLAIMIVTPIYQLTGQINEL
jgi:type IV pilus assembly protein PilC